MANPYFSVGSTQNTTSPKPSIKKEPKPKKKELEMSVYAMVFRPTANGGQRLEMATAYSLEEACGYYQSEGWYENGSTKCIMWSSWDASDLKEELYES